MLPQQLKAHLTVRAPVMAERLFMVFAVRQQERCTLCHLWLLLLHVCIMNS